MWCRWSAELSTGLSDFVGDSARFATRSCKFCQNDEVVVDETVKKVARRDFEYSQDVIARGSADG